MNLTQATIVPLTEYVPSNLGRAEISEADAELLWRNYGSQITVESPSFKTNYHWRLTSQGWVGHIPLTTALHFVLQPRVELSNLFRMLEYAYNLKSFRFLDGLVNCQSLTEFYEQLATVLARRVLDRARQGFYRAYLAESDQLSYVRGRLDIRQSLRVPSRAKLHCHYEDHTADIPDNQILAWTLQHITRSGMCTERVLPMIRRAYRPLQSLVTPTPYGANACAGRVYNRLNHDYQVLHALCRFFLDQSGPSHQLGDWTILPFLVDMARLYERFVAEWLKAHLPAPWSLKVQERVDISQVNTLHFDIDLVLYETETGRVRCVLDTKYKVPDKPATQDVFQVTAYALSKGCRQAILVYPTPLEQPLNEMIGDISVRSLTFSLDGNLEHAGRKFLQDLGIGENL